MKGEGRVDFDLILEAARMLKSGVKSSEVAKSLGTSVKDVLAAKKLMDMNVIMFDETGEPYYTMHEVELEPLIRELRKSKAKRSLPPITPNADMDAVLLQKQGVAQASIASSVEERIARKSVEMTEATYRLGDAVRMYYEEYCEYLGVNPYEARPELIIPEVFEKAKKYDRLERRVQELERIVYELQSMTDPFYRLEKCMDMLVDFIYARVLTQKALGVDIAKTEIGKFYADIMAAYLTGGVESEGENPTGGAER